MSHEVTKERIDWPLWWFARLEAAIERGDYPAAAEAQHELERLGVCVTYRGRQPLPLKEGGRRAR